MDDEEKEIRRVLQAVATAGAYQIGQVRWIQNLIHNREVFLQDELKRILNIKDCQHDY